MSRVVERIIILVIAVPLVIWGIYHVAFYAQESVETVTVFSETISHSIAGTGIAIREEVVLDDVANGSERYLHSDGTRVGINQPIIEYYKGDVKNRNVQNIHSYEEEIDMLRQAQNKNVNNYSSAPTISRDIREQLSALSQVSATGNCNELGALRSDLTYLINRRHIATGKGEDFSQRIVALENDLQTLKSSGDADNIQTSLSPISGFFVKNVDGFENELSYEQIMRMSINQLDSLVKNNNTITSNKAGKIVTDSRWYFAVSVPSNTSEWVISGQRASLKFSNMSKEIPAKLLERRSENNNETTILIFSSDFISEDVVNLRVSDVTISFTQFTGLKINTTNIRFIENEKGEKIRGVFILENNVAKFKAIDPIYEETDYIISKMSFADSDKNYIRLFDQIIVGGEIDLYDGKPIQ